MFPAERDLLRQQCDSLEHLPIEQFAVLTASFKTIFLPDTLRTMDWIQSPSAFVAQLTASLWSSSQINVFRDATNALFAAVPAREDPTHAWSL